MSEQDISEARKRILETAERLFYNQGYKATGVNQIIAEAGVAKATFYSQFPSKDDLCLLYLERTRDKEIATIQNEIRKRRTPLAKYMALIEHLEPWLFATDFRGCPFLNMVPEIPDYTSPMRKIGDAFYRECELLIEQLLRELIQSDKKKYVHINPTATAKKYMLLFSGAVALCEITHEIESLHNAIRMVRELVE